MNLPDCSSCLCGVTIGWLPSVSAFLPSWLRSRDISLHKGQHKKGWRASFGPLHKRHVPPASWRLWEGRRADGQERPFLLTHEHSHSRHYLCATMLCVNMCVRLALPPLTIFLIPTFNRYRHILFLLEDANITRDKAPGDSSETKHFLSKAVLQSLSKGLLWRSKIWIFSVLSVFSWFRTATYCSSVAWLLVALVIYECVF